MRPAFGRTQYLMRCQVCDRKGSVRGASILFGGGGLDLYFLLVKPPYGNRRSTDLESYGGRVGILQSQGLGDLGGERA
jgi:hypothetical protein